MKKKKNSKPDVIPSPDRLLVLPAITSRLEWEEARSHIEQIVQNALEAGGQAIFSIFLRDVDKEIPGTSTK
jgi:hypothetical protein